MTPVQKQRGAISTIAGFTASKAVPGVALLVATPVWIKLYGPSEYLGYSLVWAVSLIATGLSTRWLTSSILRFTGDETRTLADIPAGIRLLNILASGLIAALGACSVVAVQDTQLTNGPLVVIAGALLGAVTASYLVLQSTAQRALRSTALTVSEFIRTVGAVGISVAAYAVFPLGGASTIIGSFAISTTLAAAFLARSSRTPKISMKISSAVARESWRYGWPMAGWAALSTMSVYVDRLVVTSFDTPDISGVYAGVADVAIRSFSLLAFPATMYLHPKLMEMWNANNKAEMEPLLRKVVFGFLVYCTAVALVGGLGLAAVYQLIFPEDSLPVAVFVLAFVAAGLWQVALMAHKPLEMADKTKVMLGLLAASLAISVVVSVIGYLGIGISGAPLGLAVGAAFYSAAAYGLGTYYIRRASLEH